MIFSIIIPCYKVEQYLHQCVESVCNQSFRNIEVILVDDGSPDSCPLLCDELAKKDNRIKVIHKKNGGLSDARNVGLKSATGDYVVFLDSDDWWCDNNALMKIANRLELSQADVLIFQSKKYYQLKGIYTCRKVLQVECDENYIVRIQELMKKSIFVACAWDKVIRRTILADHNIEFVVGQLSEDIEWCCKLLSLDLSYTAIEDVVHVYRQQNATSITSNVTNRNLNDIKNVIAKWSNKAEKTENEPVQHFLALEYVLLCAITDKATGDEGKQIIKELSRSFNLLKFNWYPRVALPSKVRFVGYSVFRHLMLCAYKIKRL